jgi:hypothetical protein
MISLAGDVTENRNTISRPHCLKCTCINIIVGADIVHYDLGFIDTIELIVVIYLENARRAQGPGRTCSRDT